MAIPQLNFRPQQQLPTPPRREQDGPLSGFMNQIMQLEQLKRLQGPQQTPTDPSGSIVQRQPNTGLPFDEQVDVPSENPIKTALESVSF